MQRVILVFSVYIFLISNTQKLFSQGRYGSQLPNNSILCLTSTNQSLYNGIDNYISVDPSLIQDCNSIEVSSSNGHIIHDSANIYLILPEKAGNLRLSIYCLASAERINLGYKYFNVYTLPDPVLTLNDKPISTPIVLNKDALLNADSLGVYISENIIGSENWFSVSEFLLGYNYGGFHVSHTNQTNKFSVETLEIIRNLGPDHEISIRPSVEATGKVKKQLPIYRIRIY